MIDIDSAASAEAEAAAAADSNFEKKFMDSNFEINFKNCMEILAQLDSQFEGNLVFFPFNLFNLHQRLMLRHQ